MKYEISYAGAYSIDLKFKNILRIFSALNRQKNKNTQPGSEKQYSYKKECISFKIPIAVLPLQYPK